MKILLCISNYESNNLQHLNTILSEYSKMSYDISVSVDTTVEIDYSPYYNSLEIFQTMHDKKIKKKLVFEHRLKMIANKDDFDLFIYSENDILIKEKNIEMYLSITDKLPNSYIVGFLRYERKKDGGEPYLIDTNSSFDAMKDNNILINGSRYFKVENLHQGCFILTKGQLRKVIASNNFNKVPHTSYIGKQYYGVLESGATDVYSTCGFKKVFPCDEIENLLVHHLPDKYINLEGVWDDVEGYTLSSIKRLLTMK